MVAEYKAERRSCKHPKLRSSAAHAAGVLRSKRPKRFIMMQEYLDALRHCRAIITADERYHIDRLMRDKATYRRSSIKSGRTVNGRSPA
ncbi:hypothetical protein [Erwinia tracheiphila]|uniref:hypothetical protein n=1 Tax=Erwinia tracheiphila TaxID=65700 RepID=UPI001F432B24|nr:hypothetical protein [Erwinia tracheiphila]UIA92403.1 hypothetical protein LU632_01495 [Erwinia tracheiphila]